MPGKSNETPAPTSEPPATPPCRVLVAEDHVPTRDRLTFLLQRHGYEVTVASNGREAYEFLAAPDGPDLALLDWMLPEMTGPRICKELHRTRSERFIYFIIVTARDSIEDLNKAFEAGADDFIRKPCDPTELMARLRAGQRIVELEHRLSARVAEIETALENVRQLKRLLPICMYCKKVRDDSEYWREIEGYIHEQTGTDFSHGICPDCMGALSAGGEVGPARNM